LGPFPVPVGEEFTPRWNAPVSEPATPEADETEADETEADETEADESENA